MKICDTQALFPVQIQPAYTSGHSQVKIAIGVVELLSDSGLKNSAPRTGPQRHQIINLVMSGCIRNVHSFAVHPSSKDFRQG